MIKKSNIIKNLKYILGIIIILILIYISGIEKIINALRETNINFFLLAIATYLASIIIGAINMKILFKHIKNINIIEMTKYFWLSSSFTLILPGRIGSFSLVYFLRKKGINIGECSSMVILDKIITSILSAGLAVIGIMVFFSVAESIKMALILLVIGITGLSMFLSKKFRAIIKNKILRKYSKLFKGFFKTLEKYIRYHKSTISLNMLITIIKQIVASTTHFLLFLSLGYKIDFISLVLISGIEFIITLIPITANGLGFRESVGLILISRLGVPQEVILSRYILGLTIKYGFALLSFILIKESKERLENPLPN